MKPETQRYNRLQTPEHRAVCDLLAREIDARLRTAENTIWHAHPVWFLEGNPIVGYSRQKPGIRLMFWSGASFDEAGLAVLGKKFKDASVFYDDASQVSRKDLRRWLEKARVIQWDYAGLVRRKGVLVRLPDGSARSEPVRVSARPARKAAPRAGRRSRRARRPRPGGTARTPPRP